MIRPLVNLLVIASLATAVPPAAMAADGDVTYDTVEAVEMSSISGIAITGIISGQQAPSRTVYRLGSSGTADTGSRCDRYALLAMSKPGKYQLVLVNQGINIHACKLVVRTP